MGALLCPSPIRVLANQRPRGGVLQGEVLSACGWPDRRLLLRVAASAGAVTRIRLRTISGPASMSGMDPELSALTAALTRLDRDAALARLEVAAGGSEEDAAAIMQGRDHTERRD